MFFELNFFIESLNLLVASSSFPENFPPAAFLCPPPSKNSLANKLQGKSFLDLNEILIRSSKSSSSMKIAVKLISLSERP